MIINIVVSSGIINAVVLALFVLVNFRTFSRDIYKRQRENVKYLKYESLIKKELKLTVRKVAEGKDYSFKRCPECHQVLRLKRRRGTHQARCPKCDNKFDARMWF